MSIGKKIFELFIVEALSYVSLSQHSIIVNVVIGLHKSIKYKYIVKKI